jgi:hypothetical protein
MVSYFKTQWFRFALGCLFLILALIYLFQPAGDPSTLEGLQQDLKNEINTVAWLVSSLLWFALSYIDWHTQNLIQFDKRIKALETRAITDIDKIGPNHFMVRRRLGPDKDLPLPEEEPTIEERIKVSDKTFTYLKTSQDVLGFVPAESESLTLTGQQLKAIAFKVWEDKK